MASCNNFGPDKKNGEEEAGLRQGKKRGKTGGKQVER